jgi:trans-aconitate methyltransferase
MTAASTDRWNAWVERWDRQQERYLVDREGRFTLMLDYAEAQLETGAPKVLDLCCGNGALSRRVLERFPDAHITGVDWNPVHLEIARHTLPDRVGIVEADVARPGWSAEIDPALDLVVTATALHWLDRDPLVRLYGELARLVLPGGVFMNADHLPPAERTISALGEELTDSWQEANFADGHETHTGFHEAAAADPTLRAAVELRAERFRAHEAGNGRTLDVEFHRWALVEAGFCEAAEVWRHREDAVLLAIR